jgi:hypothetical protein
MQPLVGRSTCNAYGFEVSDPNVVIWVEAKQRLLFSGGIDSR